MKEQNENLDNYLTLPSGPIEPSSIDSTRSSAVRLTREHNDTLEAHFQLEQKPSTATKKALAARLGIPIEKINVCAKKTIRD